MSGLVCQICMFDRTDDGQSELEKAFFFLLSSILWYASAQGLTKPGSPEDWALENFQITKITITRYGALSFLL